MKYYTLGDIYHYHFGKVLRRIEWRQGIGHRQIYRKPRRAAARRRVDSSGNSPSRSFTKTLSFLARHPTTNPYIVIFFRGGLGVGGGKDTTGHLMTNVNNLFNKLNLYKLLIPGAGSTVTCNRRVIFIKNCNYGVFFSLG